jgi:hypothetical protein
MQEIWRFLRLVLAATVAVLAPAPGAQGATYDRVRQEPA